MVYCQDDDRWSQDMEQKRTVDLQFNLNAIHIEMYYLRTCAERHANVILVMQHCENTLWPLQPVENLLRCQSSYRQNTLQLYCNSKQWAKTPVIMGCQSTVRRHCHRKEGWHTRGRERTEVQVLGGVGGVEELGSTEGKGRNRGWGWIWYRPALAVSTPCHHPLASGSDVI